jgi:hypothetical protein
MKYLILLLIFICAVGKITAQTSQTDEATRLSAEVVKLFSAKKYKEAVPIAEKVVQLRETELGAKFSVCSSRKRQQRRGGKNL